MSIENTLAKLQAIIHETLPVLELFVDDNVQPGSKDCEKLQANLHRLQEHLAVYKYLKTNREISPSFGIHAKISELVTESVKENEFSTHEEPPLKAETEQPVISSPISTAEQSATVVRKMEVPLNQKFQFINDLFRQNATEYNTAIDQLNNCKNWKDADSYLEGLKLAYSWKDQNENYKILRELAKKRFL